MAAAPSPRAKFGYDINPALVGTHCSLELPHHAEQRRPSTASPAISAAAPYAGGRDLNGDGDMLDQVTVHRTEPDPHPSLSA